MSITQLIIRFAVLVIAVSLSACGGDSGGGSSASGPTTYQVGGTVAGLTGTVVLQNNGGGDATISTNGSFVFAAGLASGSSYTVTIKTHSKSQICSVVNASGVIASANVTDVSISCTSYNLIFVTSATYSHTGNMGGLAGADAICSARAAAAGLPGTYVAWLSTGGTNTVHAKDRLGAARGWMRPDRLPFADTVADLIAGKIFYPPRLDEFSVDAGKQAQVFTGTLQDGTYYTYSDASCQNWTSDAGAGSGGYADGGTSIWTMILTGNCATPRQLYCMGTSYGNAIPIPAGSGRKAFISSTSFTPGGGLAAADTRCQNDAIASGLTGSYLAALAPEGASIVSRFSTTGPTWTRTDGVDIVGTAADLATDLLLAPLNVKADGTTYMGNYGTWIGADGFSMVASGTSCSSWTSTASTQYGASGRAGRSNVSGFSDACNSTWLYLWCLQE